VISSASDVSQKRMERRYLAVWFPYLPADRILRRRATGAPDKCEEPAPLVLAEKVKGASRIAAISRKARQAGLAAGLTLADARARIPRLWVEPMDRRADADLLDAIAEDCGRFTPVVAVDSPDGMTLDITGCGALFGTEAELRLKVSQRLRRAGLHVRTVIAGAPDTARALARHGRIAIVPTGHEAEAVSGLPVAALGMEASDQLSVSRAGLKTIGALAERPSILFAARFGEKMTGRLARLQGHAPSLLTPRRDSPMLWTQRSFAEPVARSEDIEAILASLAADLCQMLLERREGMRVTEASFHRSDGVVRYIRIDMSQPGRDVAAFMRLLRERLGALADPLDPGFGFDLVRLGVLSAEPLDIKQADLDGRVIAAHAISSLTDRLSARLGQDRVLCFLPEDTHDPARAARLAPVEAITPASGWNRPQSGEAPLRPHLIFDPPQPVIVTLAEAPDGPPRAFRWRRMEHRITAYEGPERIAPEWWREHACEERDYYRVEDISGHRFWLFRTGDYVTGAGPPDWFLHGAFG